ncbi:MAG: S-layer homology domain-containing protein [Clostridiales bacterium]|nr:S-layer homology domain-containing protein [Clostridiales bacterium]
MRKKPLRAKTGERKALSLALALALFASLALAPGAHQSGKAYGAHWADSYLNRLADNNIMRGDEYGNLNPDRNITRAEFAAMLNRAFGFSENKGASFSDVAKDAWYSDDISFASYQGYFQGTGSGANPSGNLTREEAVTMICRALKIEPDPVDSLRFADSRNFAAWSKGYINAATDKGMISGYGDNTFKPGNPITRGEVAKILATVAGEIVNQPSQACLGYVNGNVTLSKSGAGLRDTVITGDLYITEGVLSGYVFLENVTVLGTIYISGAGESNAAASSIVMTDCNVNNIIIDLNHGKKVSVIAQGGTEIKNTVVKSNAYLEENNAKASAFNDIQLNGPAGTKLDLSGEFTEVRLKAPGNVVSLNKGYIDSFVSDEDAVGGSLFLEKGTELGELYIDGNATVTGTGKIEYASIGANGANIAQMPDEIYIKPGYTATINGKTMGYLEAELENATPRIENGYPKAEDVTANSASGQALGNKPGTIFWAVQEQGGEAPTEEAMRNPKNDELIVQSGSMALAMSAIDAESELSAKISGLQNGGDYELFVMLVDSKDNASKVRSVDFETLDKVKPAFLSGYPKGRAESTPAVASGGAILAPALHQLVFDVVPTKACGVYWVAMPEKSAAPTAERLVSGSGMAGEIAHNSSPVEAADSAVATITIGTLQSDGKSLLAEDTPYDVYIALKDARGNISAVSKTTIRTKDVTPPEFMAGYPMVGLISETNIPIKLMANEAATLYWALLDYGTAFPPGSPQSGELVDQKTGDIAYYWDSNDAKNAVEQARGAIKSGNLKTAPDKESQFAVSGLRAETTYDLYLLLKDASGNRSTVGKIEITTKSVVAPVAEVAFDDRFEGWPPVGSVVRLEFNKPVRVGKDGQTAKVADLAQTQKLNELTDYIELYKLDELDPTKLREKIDIDFAGGGVKVSEPSGQGTVISFQTGTATGAGIAVKMESGGRYEFDLKDISDLSGLQMKQNIRNDRGEMVGKPLKNSPFLMRPPSVKITNIMKSGGASPGELQEYDIMFGIKADDDTAGGANKDLLYATALELITDKAMTFDLFDLSNPAKPVLENQVMIPGRFIMVENEQARKASAVPPDYCLFNELPEKRYGIKITALGGVEDPKDWHDTVTLSVYGIAGYLFNLMMFDSTANPNAIEDAVQVPYTGVDIVGYPPQPPCQAVFVDMEKPFFTIGPTIVEGDSTARITGAINKAAKVYFYMVPKSEAFTTDPPNVSQQQLLTGSFNQRPGAVYGSYQVAFGGPFPDYVVAGLLPLTDYYMYYLLTPQNSMDATAVGVAKFSTKMIEVPRFNPAQPTFTSRAGSVDVEVRFDPGPNALVYWVAYNIGYGGTAATEPMYIVNAQPTSDGNVKGYGKSILVPSGTSGNFTVSNLEPGQYDVYITARNELALDAKENYCTPVKLKISPLFNSPPKVTVLPGPIIDIWGEGVYNGDIVLTFDQPLYFDPGEEHPVQPLTQEEVKSATNSIGMEVNKSSITTTPAGSASPVTSITIKYTEALISSYILIEQRITNSGGFANTQTGWLQVKLEMGADGKPAWVAAWI